MLFSTWLRDWRRSLERRSSLNQIHRRKLATHHMARRIGHVRPRLEVLEDRCLLAVTITDLGVLPGDTASQALGINDSGQVVGASSTSNGTSHAFLYSNGQMTDLGTLPGDTSSSASGINASGQVVGVSSTSNGTSHAFLYNNGQMTDLGTLPSGTFSEATGINASEQVVGDSGNSPGKSTHAFLYSNGQMTDLGTLPGDTSSSASGINASGQVVGVSSTSNGLSRAFLYSNGQMTDLGALPGDNQSFAYGISDSGQVAGDSDTTDNPINGHGFLYSNGQMTGLTPPGYTGSDAKAINDSGQVFGDVYSTQTGVLHYFLYSNGQMTDLGTLLPANSGWHITTVTAFNDAGQIVGGGIINGQQHAFLLNLNAFSLSPDSLPDGVVNASYTQAITASGSTGDKTLTYTITSGAIPAGLTFTAKTNELDISGTPTAAGTVTFKVTATDSASPPKSTSQTYTLTINAAVAPSITGNPSNQAVTVGQTATFTASASGNPAPTVQWQMSTDGGKTFSNIGGATSTTLTLGNVTASMSGYEYEARFSNSAGSTPTSAATLTVTTPVSPPAAPTAPAPPVLNPPPLLAFFDSLFGGTVTANADGTATVTDSFFGLPLLVAAFDSSGNLESVTLFGINVTLLFELL